MRYLFLITLVCFLHVAHAQIIEKVDVRLHKSDPTALQDVIIMMRDQADISAVANIRGKDAKATYVYEHLYKHASMTQQEIIRLLVEHKVRHRSYYIVNMISATCNYETISMLSRRDDVAYVIEDGKFSMLQPPARDESFGSGNRSATWGLNKIGAPTVWSMGYTGQGVVIGGQDTGYAWEVATIKSKYRGWDGMTANHDYNWHDAIHSNQGSNPCGYDSPEPCDDHNHGTHTMGTMVGDTDNNGDDIGVAPGAKWIGCRNMDNGDGQLSTYVECFEWFLAPYPVSGGSGDPTKMPHVINNSWGCPPSEGCNSTNFSVMELALNNLRSAGCVIVVSAGNSGSSCNTVNDPAAIFEGSFSVGATNSSDAIANFSSRGTVTVDGSNRLKPNVAAPGVSVRSCIKNGTFANYSGTSMAGPHVAGLVALMISANPQLAGEVDQIEDIIEQTAVHLTSSQNCNGTNGTTIPNNTFGYGRIDAVAAVNRALDELFVPFIKVDQFGYLPQAQKIAVISNPINGYNNTTHYTPPSSMVVKNSKTHQIVYTGTPTTWNSGNTHDQSGDQVWWFDFSAVTTPGIYHIAGFPDGSIKSEDFVINDQAYDGALEAAFKTFYYQRCGTAKSASYVAEGYVDDICHAQDTICKYINDPTNVSLFKNMSGGWHDAGDYNKYVNFAWKPLMDLLWSFEINPETWQSDSLNIPESGNGIPDLLDEIKYELDWLIKMQALDGGVHCVVGVQNYASASPPSDDTATRYYGPKTTSATWSTAGIFAFAARQFAKINNASMQSYAASLQSKAIDAWNWAMANPGITYYNASNNLASGEQEIDAYERTIRQLVAAVYLYDITGDITYSSYVESNYASTHMMSWGYVYPFESVVQVSLLHFSQLKGITPTVANAIRNTYRNCVDSQTEYIPSYTNHTDAYRAYVKTTDITWGSNETKSTKGNIYQEYLHFNLDNSKKQTILNITSDFIHYMHGVNPNALTYLTNMRSFGADRSINSIYHAWFNDGSTLWDDVRSSDYGPAPGFISGGPNPSWTLDGCCPSGCGNPANNSLCITLSPPSGQPALKSYYDWNTDWPQNSWEITEPAIYTQAAYLKLLSGHIRKGLDTLPTGKQVRFNTDLYFNNTARSVVLTSPDSTHYRIIVDNTGKISTESVINIPSSSTIIKDAFLITESTDKGLLIKAPDNSLWKVSATKSGTLDAFPATVPMSNYIESTIGDVVVIHPGYGWITTDTDGICYLITVSNSGKLFSKPIQCD